MVNTRRTVELITNIAILLVCGVLIWSYLARKTLKLNDVRSDASGENMVGTSLPALSGYSWASHPHTLTLFLRVGCHYCEDSMPFYRSLNELDKNGRLSSHLLTVMQDGMHTEDAYLEAHGLRLDRVFSEPFEPLKVSGTPTLLLVNARGRIEKAWVGQLSPQAEKEVIAAVEK